MLIEGEKKRLSTVEIARLARFGFCWLDSLINRDKNKGLGEMEIWKPNPTLNLFRRLQVQKKRHTARGNSRCELA